MSTILTSTSPSSTSTGVSVPSSSGSAASLNVKVAVRCRPFNKREKGMQAQSVVEIEDNKQILLRDPTGRKTTSSSSSSSSNNDNNIRTFTFDGAYGPETPTTSVYETLAAPLVEQALSGYNGTIFAYGQTGSGKTYSMMGEPSNPGVVPLMHKYLFEKIEIMQQQRPELKFLVLVSYLEIYNEVIKDLLNPSDRQLNIREHPEMGVYVQDLAEIVVKSSDDVARLLEQGTKVRHVAATAMNDRSSRSHSCFTIKIEQRFTEQKGDKERTTTLTAKINLVDLAGSERADKTGATGDVLKQGAAINKSLSALGNVINALAEGKGNKGHIPYRDSKLTRLLQHSLGGNSLTVMIAAISPADDNYDETLSTLQYANRAKNIKNDAKRNEDVNEQLIRQLREEIEALRKALAAVQAAGLPLQGNAVSSPNATNTNDTQQLTDAQKAQMEELIANLERAKAQTWEEKEKLSQLYEQERSANLANEDKVRTVMATLKEDNMELMKRMRTLLAEKTRITKDIKLKKEAVTTSKEALATAMARYQELYDADGGREDGPHKGELEAILATVEALHGRVETETGEIVTLKQALKETETKILEERAEAAAQRSLLEEDAELRKAIAEEERRRLEKDHAAVLEAKVEAERQRLRDIANQEREALVQKYSESASSEREQELELALIEAGSEKGLLLVELGRLRATHAAEIQRLKSINRHTIHDVRVEALKMFREMAVGFEEERTALENRCSELSRLLALAMRDIEHLANKNAELEKQILITAAWEPNIETL